ncbi:MAG: Tn3 family transposase [Mycobacteriales bacterium]
MAAALVNRTIRWDLIADHYDQMIRYATAIRGGTASTEAILRRFMKTGTMHPTYTAMLEVGRAQKTIFVARYLRDRDLQRQINAGLNVAESWNDGNSVLFYGKGGDIATNRRDEAELSMLCLRILQGSLVFVNTLMIQDVLADPLWARMLTDADRRGLTPLFWAHIAPTGGWIWIWGNGYGSASNCCEYFAVQQWNLVNYRIFAIVGCVAWRLSSCIRPHGPSSAIFPARNRLR